MSDFKLRKMVMIDNPSPCEQAGCTGKMARTVCDDPGFHFKCTDCGYTHVSNGYGSYRWVFVELVGPPEKAREPEAGDFTYYTYDMPQWTPASAAFD